MNVWQLGVQSRLTVISPTNDYDLFYMNETADTPQFIKIEADADFIDDDLYRIPFTFNEVGEYLIKLKDIQSGASLYEKILVVDETDYKFMLTNRKYSVGYDGAYLVFKDM